MIQFFAKKTRNKKGFTLVELLIVIAVLGILAGIAIPRLTGVTDSAKTRADEVSANAILKDVQAGLLTGQIPATTKTGTEWESVPQGGATDYLPTLDKAQSTGAAFVVQYQVTKANSSTYNIRVGLTTDNILATGTSELIE